MGFFGDRRTLDKGLLINLSFSVGFGYRTLIQMLFVVIDKVLCSESCQSNQSERSSLDRRTAGSLQCKAATTKPEEHRSASAVGQSTARDAVYRVSAHTV